MFEINKGIICNIIKKAREIDIAEDLSPSEEPDNLSDMEWKQLMVEYQDDMSYIELRNLINDLEPDQQQDVIALMYIGRGDFEKEEWQLAYKQAHTIPRLRRADYLISKNLLSDYLNEGLAKFDYSCEE